METTGRRQSRKGKYLRGILGRADAVRFQETRGMPADMSTLPESHACWGTFDAEAEPDTTRGGGAIFVRRLALRDRAKQIQVIERQKARALSVSLNTGGWCHWTVVHIDPAMRLSGRRASTT